MKTTKKSQLKKTKSKSMKGGLIFDQNDKSEEQKLIDKYKNDKFFSIIINILLVIKKVRPSMLYESGDFKKDRTQELYGIIEKLNKVIAPCVLLTSTDSFKFPRTFIYLKDSPVHKSIKKNNDRVDTDSYIAEYLGFQCKNHKYSDYRKTRVAIHYYVNDNEIITEVCEYGKIHQKELKDNSDKLTLKINKVLSPYGIVSTNTIEISYGTEERYKQLLKKNIPYIKNNIYDYENDFVNFYISDEEAFLKSSTYKHLIKLENLNLLAKLYKKYVINTESDKFYKNADTREKVSEIANILLKEDHILWSQS